jgi:hypothetical protein
MPLIYPKRVYTIWLPDSWQLVITIFHVCEWDAIYLLLFEIYVCRCFSLGHLCYSLCSNLSVHQVWTLEMIIQWGSSFVWNIFRRFCELVMLSSVERSQPSVSLYISLHKTFSWCTIHVAGKILTTEHLRRNLNSSGAPYNKMERYIIWSVCFAS